MPIEFRCSNCEQLVSAPDSVAGKPGRCPHCSGLVTIPARSSQAAEGKTDPSAVGSAIGPGPIPPSKALTPGLGYPPSGGGYGISGGPYLRAHRGPTVLTLGMLASLCGLATGSGCLCCLFLPVSFVAVVPAVGFAIPALAIGVSDLRAMKMGTMDVAGRQMTMTGTVLAAVGIGAILLGALVWGISAVAGSLSNVVRGR